MLVLGLLTLPARAVDIDKFDGTERLTVGSTRFVINNFGTFQCGWRLVFDNEATFKTKDGNIALTVKTISAEKGECGCKARTNDFHIYRARGERKTDKDGLIVPDELVAKGRIGPSNSRTLPVAAIYRDQRKFDYYINFDCTD
jgi:hypothetical protein